MKTAEEVMTHALWNIDNGTSPGYTARALEAALTAAGFNVSKTEAEIRQEERERILKTLDTWQDTPSHEQGCRNVAAFLRDVYAAELADQMEKEHG